MKVLRVEVEIIPLYNGGERRLGPWCAGIYDSRFEAVCNKYRHEFRGYPKEPLEDGCAKFHHGMLTGMWEWWQVQHWFTRWALVGLLEAGFKLNVYEVPDNACFKGETQVSYFGKEAVLVESLTDETEIWDRVFGVANEKRY